MRFGLKAWAISASLCTIMAFSAQAATLAPGGEVTPVPQETAVVGSLVGSASESFSAIPGGTFSGTLETRVYSGDSGNPHGGLTFLYQIVNNPTSSNDISRITINGFDIALTDVLWVTGTGTGPASADRGAGGDPVGFTFAATGGHGKVNPGTSSAWLVVRTDAPAFTTSYASIINGDTATVPTLVPIPEPAALTLLGMAGLALLRRRKAG